MRWLRHGLPLLIVLGAVVAAIVSPDNIEGAALIASAGLTVWALNWIFRLGVAGDRERDREEEARRYFDEHGHWPDEAPRRDRR